MKNIDLSETKALRFALAPLLIYILALTILEFGGLGFNGVGITLELQATESTEVSPALLVANHARVEWLSSVLLFVSLAIAVLTVSVSIMRATLTATGFRAFLLVGAGMALAGLAQLWAATTAGSTSLGLIFRVTHAHIGASTHVSDADLASITTLVSLVNVLAATVPAFIMLAGCSLLTLPDDAPAYPRQFLHRRMSALKTVTDLGSALLVAGALHMLLWLRWPIAFTTDSAMQKAIGEWALSVTLYCGTAYSLMIAAFYVPCSWMLTKNAERLLRRTLPESTEAEQADWLEEHGFSAAPARQLPQIIAALAPMLAGPIGSVITGLGGSLG